MTSGDKAKIRPRQRWRDNLEEALQALGWTLAGEDQEQEGMETVMSAAVSRSGSES